MGSGVEGVMVTPAVSVVMAVYDPPLAMLDQAVESILTQTFRDFEFLILDDGSPDQVTRFHLDMWSSRDARLRVFRDPHHGLTSTLNRGSDLALGEFIARQDADDWSEPHRFFRQLEYLRAHPAIALAGKTPGYGVFGCRERRRSCRRLFEKQSVCTRLDYVPPGSRSPHRRVSRTIPVLAGLRFLLAPDRSRGRGESGRGSLSLSIPRRRGQYAKGSRTEARLSGFPNSRCRETKRRAGGHFSGARRSLSRRVPSLLKASRSFNAGRRFFRRATSLSKLIAVATRKWLGMAKLFRLALFAAIPPAHRHLVPLAFVASLAVSTIFPFPWSIAVLAAYAAVNLAASLQIAITHRRPSLLALPPIAFATLHLAYGLGSGWGSVELICELMEQRTRQPVKHASDHL
jgi:glycosyltransferase involved in cell wall biosynthesis